MTVILGVTGCLAILVALSAVVDHFEVKRRRLCIKKAMERQTKGRK